MTAQPFVRVLRPGHSARGLVFITVKLEQRESGLCLSLTGVEGPKSNGDARGSSGQCTDALAYLTGYAPGWSAKSAARLKAIWERWHLNNMRAGCEHQRAELWDQRPIDLSKPLDAYGNHVEGVRPSWNMLTWVTRKEHPKGLLGEPCPTCGYKYGSAWLHEDLPAEVVEELMAMPESDLKHPWRNP